MLLTPIFAQCLCACCSCGLVISFRVPFLAHRPPFLALPPARLPRLLCRPHTPAHVYVFFLLHPPLAHLKLMVCEKMWTDCYVIEFLGSRFEVAFCGRRRRRLLGTTTSPLWLALAHALDCCVSHFVTFICRLIWFRFPWVFPLWACLCPLPFSLLYLPYPCWSGGGEQEDRFAVKKEVKLSWVLGLGMGIRTGQGSASLILCRTISAICWIDPYRRGMWSSSLFGL